MLAWYIAQTLRCRHVYLRRQANCTEPVSLAIGSCQAAPPSIIQHTPGQHLCVWPTHAGPPAGHMLLDACAIRSLELLANSDGKLPGSLLHFLDRAATAAGRRKVRHFISAPLFR